MAIQAAPQQGLAAPATASARAELKPRLSVCLIVRNEERFLAQCLRSVRAIADQIVVVDTGSTDRTVEIAREFGAEVHALAWCDDFSAARNAALEHATGDWVLALDADEELPLEEHSKLHADMANPATLGCRIPLLNVGAEAQGVSYVPRLFRNAPGLFYISRVHEQIFSSLLVRAEEWGLETPFGSAQIRHHGYTPELVRDRQKGERNLRLLRRATEEFPDSANLLMNLGMELVRSGERVEGLERYGEAFRALTEHREQQQVPELREALLTQYSSHLLQAGNFSEVIGILQSPIARLSPPTASLHFALGLALMKSGNLAAAIDEFRQCIARRGQPALCPINPEILKAGPHHCLAQCLLKNGDTPGALEALVAALADEPGSRGVRLDLARAHAMEGAHLESLTLLHGLIGERPDDKAAWHLGGELALAHSELFEFALDWTGEAIKHHPAEASLIAQRAEALLLAGDAAGSLEFWRGAHSDRPASRAARCLCELLVNGSQAAIPPADEPAVSREFVKWYQRLVRANAETLLGQLNGRLPALAAVLPTAAALLQSALDEVAS